MTLRDISNSISKASDALVRDWNIVLTASPLDWPLYMMVAVGVCWLVILVAILRLPLILWQAFWNNHFDEESRPITPLGVAVDKGLDILKQVGVFIIFWFVAFFLVGALLMIFDGGQISDDAIAMKMGIVLILPTIIAGGVMYLAHRGRKMKEKEKELRW